MPFHFITINCHTLDIQLFDDIYNWIIPHLKLISKTLIWNVEKDGTPQQHLHILIDHSKKDGDKLKNYINNKEFKKLLLNTNTILSNCLNIQTIPKKSGKYCWEYRIGYICKETISKRSCFNEMTREEINTNVEFYYSIERIENKPEKYKSDKISITSKNIHTYYEMESKKDETIKPHNFQVKMTCKGYSFLNITSRQCQLFTNELLLLEDPTNDAVIQNISNYQHGTEYNYDFQKVIKDFFIENIDKMDDLGFQIPSILRNWIFY